MQSRSDTPVTQYISNSSTVVPGDLLYNSRLLSRRRRWLLANAHSECLDGVVQCQTYVDRLYQKLYSMLSEHDSEAFRLRVALCRSYIGRIEVQLRRIVELVQVIVDLHEDTSQTDFLSGSENFGPA